MYRSRVSPSNSIHRHRYMGDSQQAYPTWSKSGVLPAVSLMNRTRSKPSWQVARDISMDLLSRRATRLSFKQGRDTCRFYLQPIHLEGFVYLIRAEVDDFFSHSLCLGSYTSNLTDDLLPTNRNVQPRLDQPSKTSNVTRLPRMPGEEQAMLVGHRSIEPN